MNGTPEDQGEDRRAGEGSRILVVDDEKTIHIAMTRILERHGHRVDAAYGGLEALKLLASRNYDLVITDLMMPEMNGMELMQSMRARGQAVPVLMVTGYPTIRTALEALRLGAVDYVSKPFTREELLGPVHRVLRQPAAEPPGAPAPEPVPQGNGSEPARAEPRAGDRFYLRKHSWAVYREDGTVEVGIEPSFLGTLDTVTSLEIPAENDHVEQGYVAFKLTTASGERHNVFAPLSGRVLRVNREALENPGALGAETWLLRLQPLRLEAELSLLLRS